MPDTVPIILQTLITLRGIVPMLEDARRSEGQVQEGGLRIRIKNGRIEAMIEGLSINID
jgi:hypothetical protein